eukprot:787896-Rhodomonas_salina.1
MLAPRLSERGCRCCGCEEARRKDTDGEGARRRGDGGETGRVAQRVEGADRGRVGRAGSFFGGNATAGLMVVDLHVDFVRCLFRAPASPPGARALTIQHSI